MLISLREDFNAAGLRSAARESKDVGQTRRLLALAAICEGATRTEAARIGGVTLQIVRDWVIKLNVHGPAGLIDRRAPGQKQRLDDAHRAPLAPAVESGPISAVHGVVCWRVVDLCQWLHDEFQVSVSEQTLSRELRELGYRKLSARPRHTPSPLARSRLLKSLPARLDEIAREQGVEPGDIEVWLATRPGSARRTRSRAAGPRRAHARPPRTTSALRRPTSSAPSARRTARRPGLSCRGATSRRWTCTWPRSWPKVAPGRHAALLLDQAGWHTWERLAVPPNIIDQHVKLPKRAATIAIRRDHLQPYLYPAHSKPRRLSAPCALNLNARAQM